MDATRVVMGSPDVVVGKLNGTTGTQRARESAIQVTLTRNGRYAFVCQEYGARVGMTPGNVDVFRLQESSANGSVSGVPVGFLNLGGAVADSVLSPDGRNLYATSGIANASATTGFLSLIDVETMKTDSGQALRFNTTAGCQPVHVLASSDGNTVWVMARASNRLLAFDAAKFESQLSDAPIASAQVGTSPVGLVSVRIETRILTADSNRHGFTNATSGLSVVDVRAALAGSSASVLGRVSTGLFPCEFALSPDGKTVLVTDYTFNQLQAVDVASLT